MSDTQPAGGAVDLSLLGQSPELYPQNMHFQRQDILLIRMNEQAYRAALFLDNRVITRETERHLVRESMMVEALAGGVDARPLHYIFHCGHVGSTLLSRLLDETEQVLALREPLPLRNFADAYDASSRRDPLISEERLNTCLEMFLKLWSRGFASTRAVIVKATSATARLAPRLLTARPDSRAVYLSLPAEPYLATMLAGQNSAVDLKGFAAERARRVEAFLKNSILPFHLLPLVELAAMSWLAERLTERKILAEFGQRILPLDFEEMLQDIKGTLTRVTGHFQMKVEAKYFDAIAQSPTLGRYSKAPEHEYSPERRTQILTQAREEKAAEIKKGLAWLDKLGAKHPEVAELLRQKPA